MTSAEFAELLKLTPNERAELAIALWESLAGEERNEEFELSEEDRAEFDRRWTEHAANPNSAIPWTELRQRLLDGK